LIGDASKAKRQLGWVYDLEFKDLVKDMVKSAINRIGYWDLGTPYVSLDVKKL
jgi:GDP-D-mannose dehydratase